MITNHYYIYKHTGKLPVKGILIIVITLKYTTFSRNERPKYCRLWYFTVLSTTQEWIQEYGVGGGGVYKTIEAAKQPRIFPCKLWKMFRLFMSVRKHCFCVSAANDHWLYTTITQTIPVLSIIAIA